MSTCDEVHKRSRAMKDCFNKFRCNRASLGNLMSTREKQEPRGTRGAQGGEATRCLCRLALGTGQTDPGQPLTSDLCNLFVSLYAETCSREWMRPWRKRLRCFRPRP